MRRFLSWRRTHGPEGAERKPLSDYTIRREYATFRRVLSYGVEL